MLVTVCYTKEFINKAFFDALRSPSMKQGFWGFILLYTVVLMMVYVYSIENKQFDFIKFVLLFTMGITLWNGIGLGVLFFRSYFIFKQFERTTDLKFDFHFLNRKILVLTNKNNLLVVDNAYWRWIKRLQKGKQFWLLFKTERQAFYFPTDQLPAEAQAFILQKLTEYNVPIIGQNSPP